MHKIFPAFTYYLDHKPHVISAAKVIIQLDSLHRLCIHHPYDMLVLDEAHSTALHSASTLMKSSGAVIATLRDLLISSKQVIMLDASMDNFPAYHFVQWVERARGVPATWVRNRFVRDPERTATLHTCTSNNPRVQSRFLDSAFNYPLEAFKAGHRVFVPSSSKTVAMAVHKLLAEAAEGTGRKVLLITGDTDELERNILAERFEETLQEYDAFVCSPAITAGCSFEVPGHFTRTVPIMVNTGYRGPTVDSSQQQWARVRSLTSVGPTGEIVHGSMSIFVLDPECVAASAGPTDPEGIAKYLEVRQGDGRIPIESFCWRL